MESEAEKEREPTGQGTEDSDEEFADPDPQVPDPTHPEEDSPALGIGEPGGMEIVPNEGMGTSELNSQWRTYLGAVSKTHQDRIRVKAYAGVGVAAFSHWPLYSFAYKSAFGPAKTADLAVELPSLLERGGTPASNEQVSTERSTELRNEFDALAREMEGPAMLVSDSKLWETSTDVQEGIAPAMHWPADVARPVIPRKYASSYRFELPVRGEPGCLATIGGNEQRFTQEELLAIQFIQNVPYNRDNPTHLPPQWASHLETYDRALSRLARETELWETQQDGRDASEGWRPPITADQWGVYSTFDLSTFQVNNPIAWMLEHRRIALHWWEITSTSANRPGFIEGPWHLSPPGIPRRAEQALGGMMNIIPVADLIRDIAQDFQHRMLVDDLLGPGDSRVDALLRGLGRLRKITPLTKDLKPMEVQVGALAFYAHETEKSFQEVRLHAMEASRMCVQLALEKEAVIRENRGLRSEIYCLQRDVNQRDKELREMATSHPMANLSITLEEESMAPGWKSGMKGGARRSRGSSSSSASTEVFSTPAGRGTVMRGPSWPRVLAQEIEGNEAVPTKSSKDETPMASSTEGEVSMMSYLPREEDGSGEGRKGKIPKTTLGAAARKGTSGRVLTKNVPQPLPLDESAIEAPIPAGQVERLEKPPNTRPAYEGTSESSMEVAVRKPVWVPVATYMKWTLAQIGKALYSKKYVLQSSEYLKQKFPAYFAHRSGPAGTSTPKGDRSGANSSQSSGATLGPYQARLNEHSFASGDMEMARGPVPPPSMEASRAEDERGSIPERRTPLPNHQEVKALQTMIPRGDLAKEEQINAFLRSVDTVVLRYGDDMDTLWQLIASRIQEKGSENARGALERAQRNSGLEEQGLNREELNNRSGRAYEMLKGYIITPLAAYDANHRARKMKLDRATFNVNVLTKTLYSMKDQVMRSEPETNPHTLMMGLLNAALLNNACFEPVLLDIKRGRLTTPAQIIEELSTLETVWKSSSCGGIETESAFRVDAPTSGGNSSANTLFHVRHVQAALVENPGALKLLCEYCWLDSRCNPLSGTQDHKREEAPCKALTNSLLRTGFCETKLIPRPLTGAFGLNAFMYEHGLRASPWVRFNRNAEGKGGIWTKKKTKTSETRQVEEGGGETLIPAKGKESAGGEGTSTTQEKQEDLNALLGATGGFATFHNTNSFNRVEILVLQDDREEGVPTRESDEDVSGEDESEQEIQQAWNMTPMKVALWADTSEKPRGAYEGGGQRGLFNEPTNHSEEEEKERPVCADVTENKGEPNSPTDSTILEQWGYYENYDGKDEDTLAWLRGTEEGDQVNESLATKGKHEELCSNFTTATKASPSPKKRRRKRKRNRGTVTDPVETSPRHRRPKASRILEVESGLEGGNTQDAKPTGPSLPDRRGRVRMGTHATISETATNGEVTAQAMGCKAAHLQLRSTGFTGFADVFFPKEEWTQSTNDNTVESKEEEEGEAGQSDTAPQGGWVTETNPMPQTAEAEASSASCPKCDSHDKTHVDKVKKFEKKIRSRIHELEREVFGVNNGMNERKMDGMNGAPEGDEEKRTEEDGEEEKDEERNTEEDEKENEVGHQEEADQELGGLLCPLALCPKSTRHMRYQCIHYTALKNKCWNCGERGHHKVVCQKPKRKTPFTLVELYGAKKASRMEKREKATRGKGFGAQLRAQKKGDNDAQNTMWLYGPPDAGVKSGRKWKPEVPEGMVEEIFWQITNLMNINGAQLRKLADAYKDSAPSRREEMDEVMASKSGGWTFGVEESEPDGLVINCGIIRVKNRPDLTTMLFRTKEGTGIPLGAQLTPGDRLGISKGIQALTQQNEEEEA